MASATRYIAGLILCCCECAGTIMAQSSPVCQVAQLSVAEDRQAAHQVEGGLGHHAFTIAIRNDSSTTCVLRGIPRLQLLDGAKRVIPAPICSNCIDYLFPKQPIHDVLLKPSESAYVIVAFNINDGIGPCRNAAAFSFTLDGNREPLQISVRQMQTCGRLNVTPFSADPLPEQSPR